ncbi:MAG: hypothetical protein RMX68_008585 [Aulosira sp. ZfuVER01]|nr:hypothetical protein [Aulosira sp. ZfuVER01]MDZ7997421.1 hypothetical protein [Aulosira sp. DedVER01a]MDZ8054550.1 hypothetical protein [Aulosira sp. ZfuCHP01]
MLSQIFDALNMYLPPPVPPLPAPSLSAIGVTERTIGLGNRRGNETRGGIAVVALKGGRLDAVVRFQLWASQFDEVETALIELRDRLEADKVNLRSQGFLRFALEAISQAEFNPTLNAWFKTLDCKVLYEFYYQDTDGAESLITRIPVAINGEYSESTIVTGDMVRWDNERSPTLVVQGSLIISRLTALVFIPGTTPAGAVLLTRRDGSASSPTIYPTLAAFLSAIADAKAPTRNALVIFPTFSDFLSAFQAAGDPVTLGDWNQDGVPDTYQSRALVLNPAIELANFTDRLEIAYQDTALNQVAVVYLRAGRK